MTAKTSFRGSFTALVTPFKNGALDEKAFRDLVDWQIDEGTNGPVSYTHLDVYKRQVFAETREKPGGGLRIVQEAQRHPAGGEIMVGAEKTARRRGGVARDPVGGARIAVVEQLAN